MTIQVEASPPVVDEGAVGEFADAFFGDLLGAMNTYAVAVGCRLGWYDALAAAETLTSIELSETTATDERYAREWLEHQTVAGYLDCIDPSQDPTERRFALPAAHAPVLADSDSVSFLAPFAEQISTFVSSIDGIVEAYRDGSGFGWHQHGDGGRCGQAAGSKPLFLHQLTQDYLSQIDGARETLADGGRVADIGCGLGWSSIGIALACPLVTVDGFDIDGPSIELARANAKSAGVADRVTFHQADVGTVDAGRYDLAIALECIHDMADPVSVLAAVRSMVKPGGTTVIMDERVGERFTGEPDPVEQMMYGFSLICCLPDGRDAAESVATGTVMRPATLEKYATSAGFGGVEVLDLEHDSFRFYRLTA